MIHLRKKGLLSIYTIILLLLFPAWFFLLAKLNPYISGTTVLFQQIDFRIYVLGMELAILLSITYNDIKVPMGSPKRIWLSSVKQSNQIFLFNFIIFLSIIWATKDKSISRQFVGAYFISSWIFLVFINRFFLRFLSQIIFKGKNELNTALIGSPHTASKLEAWSEQQNSIGINVLGLISNANKHDNKLCKIPYIGATSELEEIIQNNSIQQIILLETRNSKSWVHFVSETCKKNGIRLLIFNQWEEYFSQPITTVNEGDLTFFSIGHEPLQNPVNRIIKRALDISIALPVVILILPLLACFIKCMQYVQSPGPLFFKQYRTGFGKKNFLMIKFRSMHVNPKDDTTKQASIGDKRIFKFGSFLRRSSLDEFPQFINVLRGTMSIVGPRPHMVEHDQEFAKLIEFYKTRHFVKPGITGLAQQRGFRGEIIKSEHIEGRIELDLYYVNNWSIWMDLGLIIKTFSQLIFPPKSAY